MHMDTALCITVVLPHAIPQKTDDKKTKSHTSMCYKPLPLIEANFHFFFFLCNLLKARPVAIGSMKHEINSVWPNGEVRFQDCRSVLSC